MKALNEHMEKMHIPCHHCAGSFSKELLQKHLRMVRTARMLDIAEEKGEIVICPSYVIKRGKCKFGDRCKYSHDVEEFERQRLYLGACRNWFNKGYCHQGLLCKYTHSEEWLIE